MGFSADELAHLSALDPVRSFGDSLTADAQAASRFFAAGQALIDRLPARASRPPVEQAAAEALHQQLRATRTAFLRRHTTELYSALTDGRSRFVRVEELIYRAAEVVPGLVPTRAQIAAEREHPQKDKEGYEVDQGVFLSCVLSDPLPGGHLVHAMLRPRQESLDLLADFQSRGSSTLATPASSAAGRWGMCCTATHGF